MSGTVFKKNSSFMDDDNSDNDDDAKVYAALPNIKERWAKWQLMCILAHSPLLPQ